MADLSLILGKNLKTLIENFQQPLVSVIMPCYKMGRFIGEALESVGKQTYTNWEVLAVDDCGPEDGTKEAGEAFNTGKFVMKILLKIFQ